MELEKKIYNRFKTRLKRMLILLTKFGTKKGKLTPFNLYTLMDKDSGEFHPIFILEHIENPWGPMYCPQKAIIVHDSFPEDPYITTDELLESGKYELSLSHILDIVSFKEYVNKSMVQVHYDEGLFDFPGVIYTTDDYKTGYMEKLRENEDVRKIMDIDKPPYDLSKLLVIKLLRDQLKDDNNMKVPISDTEIIELPFSMIPAPIKALSCVSNTERNNGTTTTLVWLQQETKDVKFCNFYKFINIWINGAGLPDGE